MGRVTETGGGGGGGSMAPSHTDRAVEGVSYALKMHGN